MWAIIFALGSMGCAAINDFIFKLYIRKGRPVGIYMALIGVVWTGVFAVAAGGDRVLHPDHATLAWGLISGVLSALANILLIEAMGRHEVGECATIYRLNLAPAAIMAFVFLGESASALKLLGIGAAVVAVVLLFSPDSRGTHSGGRLWLAMIVMASLLRASMGIAYKFGANAGGDYQVILALNGAVWIISGLIYHGLRGRARAAVWAGKALTYGLCSGVLICGIVFFMMSGLRVGQASTVLPIAQLSFLGTSMIGMIFLREACTPKKVMGLLAAVLCIVLMALDQ